MGLAVRGLKAELQNTEILKGIDLDIPKGSFISLLGPSGCGKTTFLKSVAGLLPVTAGTICVAGTDITGWLPEKRGTVIVFQDLRLFPHMTVEKNICFPMELQKVSRIEQRKRTARLLEDVQLSGFEKRKIGQLSGGQMQRVALARALAAEPKVLLLDEPFSGLDEKLRGEMGTLVKELQRKKQITTILVTHDKREALQMSDQIALMFDGEIVQYERPEKMYYHPVSRQAAEYFGKVNYIPGAVKDGIFTSPYLTFATNTADGAYEAAVRLPEAWLDKEGAQFEIRDIIFSGESTEVVLDDGKIDLMVSDREQKCRWKRGEKAGVRFADKAYPLFEKETV